MSEPPAAGPPRRAKVIALVVVVLGAVVLAGALQSQIEVVDPSVPRGESPSVAELKVFDRYTVYAEDDLVEDPTDPLTGILLAAAGASALLGLMLLRSSGGREADPSLDRFLLLASAGAFFLSLDELLGLHETVGHNALFLAALPGIDHASDTVMVLYAVFGVAFFVRFWGILSSSRQAVRLIVVAVALGALGGGLDILSLGLLEEPLEVLAAAVGLAGFLVLVRERVGEALAGAAGPVGAPSGPAAHVAGPMAREPAGRVS